MLKAGLRHAGWTAGWLFKTSLAVVVGGTVLLVGLAGGLAWRLSDRPLDVTGLVRRVAVVVAPGFTAQHVTLAMQRDGQRHVLRIEVQDAERVAEPGEQVQQVHYALVTLAVAPLMTGTMLPETLVLNGAHLRVVLPKPDGRRRASPAPLDKELARLLSGLPRITIADAEIDLTGGAAGHGVRLQVVSADLQPGADGELSGRATVTGVAGGASVRLEAQGRYGKVGAQLHAELSPVSPAALAGALPELAPLSALDAPVALTLDAGLDPALTLRHAAVHADVGAGTALLPADKGGTSPARFASMTLDADGTPDAIRLQALHLVLAPVSGAAVSNLVLSGGAALQGGRFTAQLALDVDHLDFVDLPDLWPQNVGGGARTWLTENMTAGTVHDGHFTVGLQGDQSGGNIALTQAAGSATGEDVTLWWLRPVPPVQHAHAVLAWQSPDALLISATGGRQGAIVAKTATVRITGLTVEHQVALINADLAGPLGDVITLLKQPRLDLLSKRPPGFDSPSGAVTAHLTIQVPLEAKVTMDQVPIHAHGLVADTHLGSVAAGRDLDAGQLTFDVTNDGLSITGPAQIDHLPGSLAVAMDFRDGPKSQVLQHVTATLQADAADAKAAGLSAIGLQSGGITAAVDYAERRDNTATLQVDMDLNDGAFITPLGWSKAAGVPGHAAGRALLDHGKLVGLDGLSATAPGLAIEAKSDLVAGRPAVVHLQRGDIGHSSATGTIALPARDGDPYRVTLSGPQLDLEGRLNSREAPAASNQDRPPAKPGTPYVVDLRFDHVLLAPKRGLDNVALTATGTGQRLSAARLVTGGAERVRAALVTVGQERRLTATAADLGALLSETDLATEIDGGALNLNGAFVDSVAGSPFRGSVQLLNFKVRGAPITGKLLQAITVYGLTDALNGSGLSFDELNSDFVLQGPVLDVTDARASSSSLGLTAAGRFDFGQQTIDLHGTIVPAYFFNSLPGRIPLLGRMFSPEKGSGVFAANYGLQGPLKDPSVSINPLSALTPGFARHLFDLFD